MKNSSKIEMVFIIIGVFFISIGLFINEFILAYLYSPDGIFESETILKIRFYNILSILTGIIIIFVRKKNLLSKSDRFHYYMGLLTSFSIIILFTLFIGYKVGFVKSATELFHLIIPQKILYIPDDILKELTELKAPIGNAGNPTNVQLHNTILVHPDKQIGYALNPNTTINAYMMNSITPLNLDPPVINIKAGSAKSENLINYLKHHSRISYSYSIDENGFRNTIPKIESLQKILIIGDSMPFGVGVSDEYTVASQLQKMLDNSYQVVNGGVGGYGGFQAVQRAEIASRKIKYSKLIYIACQNDLTNLGETKEILSNLKLIANRFDEGVIVYLHTYMEFNLNDIFLSYGWSSEQISYTNVLRDTVSKICRESGFTYIDWSNFVNEFMLKEKSIFSRFALYSDHAHLSPLGYKLMAEELYKHLTVNKYNR